MTNIKRLRGSITRWFRVAAGILAVLVPVVTAILLAWTFISPVSIAATSARSGPQYLLFEMSTFLPPYPARDIRLTRAIFPGYAGSPTNPAQINAYAISKANIALQVDDMLAAVKVRGDHVNRQLGFVIGPLAFDLTDDQLRTVIDNAFAVAQERDVAVGLHIDDAMFWINRKDLWSDQNNVEWSDWQGTVIPHRTIGWVDLTAPILAPPMCFTSPVMKAEARRIARDVIGPEIKKNVDHLAAIGKSYLFAGVLSDWEPHMQDDSHPPVFCGYCALHHLGYSAQNPPKDIDLALQDVVVNWIILWDKALRDAGIPRDRIFTHIAYMGDPPPYIPANLIPRSYFSATPTVIAFNEYSYPGFSIYTTDHFAELYKMLAAHGNPPWGISEGNPTNPFSGAIPSTMEQYLAKAYNHGATYVTLFQWVVGAHDPALSGATAIQTYQKFLQGGDLHE